MIPPNAKAEEIMNIIEAFIRAATTASVADMAVALNRSPATINHHTRNMWMAGRIRYFARATARSTAVWEIGFDPYSDRDEDIADPKNKTVKTWPPHHKRGVLECLWFGVPAAMVIG